MGTPLPSARKTTFWVETAPGVFTQIQTDTGFSWNFTRDEAKEDYRGAANKRSYVGGLDISGSINISRTETDIAYDTMAAAVISGESINVQERNPLGIKCEANVVCLSMTPTHGLNESSKVAINYSIADNFEWHATEKPVA